MNVVEDTSFVRSVVVSLGGHLGVGIQFQKILMLAFWVPILREQLESGEHREFVQRGIGVFEVTSQYVQPESTVPVKVCTQVDAVVSAKR